VEDQIYTNWELCIADDASTNPKLIKYLKSLEKNKKIKVVFRKKNGHISEASNTALELAEGEYIALMDNDDMIYPHALAETVKVLNKNKKTDFIYSDEDKITIRGKRVEPTFKPDWSPDYLLETNYICHFTVIRRTLVDSVGGFRRGYEGSQDYDLFLRVTERTNNIKHIPDVLYSWRKIPGSTAMTYGQKGYANKTSMKALKDTIKRRNLNATLVEGESPGFFRVEYSKR
jgi:glycosyltransferase involved in cell wall biosynthesis